MKAMVIPVGMMNIVLNPPIDIRVADGVANIVVEKSAYIGNSFITLLMRLDLAQILKTIPEETIDMVIMHISSHIAVIPVAQNRNIVKKDIGAL